ncbi:hypothetical protein BH10ACT3_BH10ACT3_07350 [soil metagenome]
MSGVITGTTAAAAAAVAGQVRVVEFDVLEDHAADVDLTRAGAWLETPIPVRPRVLREAPSSLGRFDLPTSDADAPYSPPVEEPIADPDADRRGAAVVAWGVAYRDGFAQGQHDGFARGHADGHGQGSQLGHDRALQAGHAASDQLLTSLELQITAHAERLDLLAEQIAAQATTLAVQIAELVPDRELTVTADPGAEAIRRAARMLPDTGAAEVAALTARLHPDDVARLTANPASLIAGRSITVLGDAAVPSGSCVLESGSTRVDASIPSALARVRVALGLDQAPTSGPA